MASSLKNLDFKTAGFWPEPIKIAAYILVFGAVLFLSWLLWFSSQWSELDTLERKEKDLRTQYNEAQTKANNLAELKTELTQINDLLKTLVTRLPNKNEIPELVVDVSQAALANGLQVDLFEPQEESKKEFYAEKQINVKLKGAYHQLGSFFSEVAKQPRLVSVVINDMRVDVAPHDLPASATPTPPNATTELVERGNTALTFAGTVRTYRYLSEEEEEEMAQALAEADAAKKKKEGKKPPTQKESPTAEPKP